MGEGIKKVDLDRMHRLGAPKKDKVRLTVKLVRNKTRSRVFRNKKKKLKWRKVSITKNLTKMQRKTLKKAREEFEFHNVWTYDATSSPSFMLFCLLIFLVRFGVSGFVCVCNCFSHVSIFLSFTGNTPLLFYFELIFGFETMLHSIFFNPSIFLLLRHFCFSYVSNDKTCLHFLLCV